MQSSPPGLAADLRRFMAASPWKEPDDFVFPSRNRKTPISGNVARNALYRALGVLGDRKSGSDATVP